ncbi:MAG: phasin family protein, partial [Pseudomonadota bacterium]|nr:phasin family protein [Pseudomonadota bacterium]
SVEATKAMMGAKTAKEFVEIQAEFARTSLDNFLSESTRLSEAAVKIANEAYEPLQKQLYTSFEKAFKVPAL